MIKVGDKVAILTDISPLQYRRERTGIVTNIEGAVFTVRPSWVDWTIDLSLEELRLIRRFK